MSAGLFTFRTQRAVEWPITVMGLLLTALSLIAMLLFTRRLSRDGLATSSLK